MKRAAIAIATVVFLLICSVVFGATQKPWWEQEQIRFFWNPWMNFHAFGPTGGVGDVDVMSDEQLIDAVSGVGATVFADRFEWSADAYYGDTMATRLNRARLAKANGMHYFGQLQVAYMPELVEKTGARMAVNKDGKTCKEDSRSGGRFVACPLDEKAAAVWPFKYAEEMAKSGVVDGLLIDWEGSLSGFGFEFDNGICYCDDCWGNYANEAGIREKVSRADRYKLLENRGLLTGYWKHQQDCFIDLYRRGAERVHAMKPDFIFSAYEAFMPGHMETGWLVEGAARGLNSTMVPFFVIDAGQYYPNHVAPWWDTGHDAFRKLGMKHLLGYYPSGFMGTPTMDASAAQQLYDAAINTDGYWIWHERKWGPDDYAVMRAAHERVRATEIKVGGFLRDGQVDNTFATAVEQSGDPVLGRGMVTRTYHLGGRHLVHINNVNTDNAVAVLVRLPRLKAGAKWSASNALTGVYYSNKPGNAIWTSVELKQGVLLNLEKRSEAWLLIAPNAPSAKIVSSQMIPGWVINGHPDRPATGPLPVPGKPTAGSFPLAFTRSGPLGYSGAHEPVMGTSIWLADASAGDNDSSQVFAIKGNCWSPKLSPDRTRVAFASYVNGKGQIYMVNSDAVVKTGLPGSEQVYTPYFNTKGMAWRFDGLLSFGFKSEGANISNNSHCDYFPVWSPDGERIAFVSDRDGDWEIYVMNADGGNQKRLTRSPGIDRNPSWSPDGRFITFETNRNGDFDIGVVGTLRQAQGDGAGERVLVDRSGDDLEPLWSPDGSRIAFTGSHANYARDIMLVDPISGSLDYPRGLLATIEGWWPYNNVGGIAWSPDGKHIAATFDTRDESGVCVVRAKAKSPATGAAAVTLGDEFNYSSDHKKGDFVELVKAPCLKTRPGGIVMSPLRHLVTGGSFMSGDASNRWVLREFRDIAWSPDSQTVAFRSDMDPSGYDFLYTVPAVGGDPIRLDDTLSPMGLANTPSPLVETRQRLNPVVGAAADAWQPPKGTKVLVETPEHWMFRKDPDKVGEAQKWFTEPPSGPLWSAVSTFDFWDKSLGTSYYGDGWYAVDVVVPPVQEKKAWLHFGAVDENYTLWLNGERIGDNLTAGTIMWDQPVSAEITGKLKDGQANHIVVRVNNTANAGGIWKPVRILVEK